ncbi:MAG: serine protein kinase PrkA [bacterium]|nr:serine protein kinase PrkA [bacterium]
MSVEKAFENLKIQLGEKELCTPISFDDFLKYAAKRPNNVFRNIFQLFYDMINYYVQKDDDESLSDPEWINFVKYDCHRLFVHNTDTPFLADTPFSNRLVTLANSFRSGAQRNKIYIFEGPTGSGKSTFLNNLLLKIEEYTSISEGLTYEIVWRIDKQMLGAYPGLDDLYQHTGKGNGANVEAHVVDEIQHFLSSPEPLEVTCPSHDNPILAIPKQYRRSFFDKIIEDSEFKKKLFKRKEYEWIFKDELCTICSSIYQTLLKRLDSPAELFKMIHVRKYQFNRRLGEGISVYNPGDMVMKDTLTNPVLQKILNNLFRDSNAVRYVFSSLARTNNGMFSIMDIKTHNKDRIINLHGIISDSVHKVEHIEERVNSLFMALMNPEDKDVVESVKSLGDRIMRIPIPYVLDYHTEVEIYYNKFGREKAKKILPRVLENFAKVVISSRIYPKSEALERWIKDPRKYSKYCDKDLLLLKMELYSGFIPPWLTEEDRKNFDAQSRRDVIGESEKDGLDENSISGRKSIEIFNEFYSKYSKDGSLIDMAKLYKFFTDNKDRFKKIPENFLDSLVTLYDFNILQEIKESIYSYNEKEISKEVLNYMFAVNFEIGSNATCVYTDDELTVTEEFLMKIEERLDKESGKDVHKKFRAYVQKEYTSHTLTYEIGVEKKDIRETTLYALLMEKYQYNLKEDVLNPFLDNDNFRNAIKEYGQPEFKSYDKNIIRDVKFLIKNITKNYGYTEEGAKQVCIYVIDNKIPDRFSEK